MLVDLLIFTGILVGYLFGGYIYQQILIKTSKDFMVQVYGQPTLLGMIIWLPQLLLRIIFNILIFIIEPIENFFINRKKK